MWSATAYVLLLGAGVGATGVVPILGAVIGTGLVGWAWVSRAPASVWALPAAPLGLGFGVPWPLPALIALGLARVAERRHCPMPARPFTSGGRVRVICEIFVAAALCAPIAAALSACSLDGQRIVIAMRFPGIPTMIAVILALATLNAVAEELMWRGRLMRILTHSGLSPNGSVLVQATSFGLAHVGGLPGGMAGVGGALVLGLVLGVLRGRHAGLLGCVVVHVVVDVAIFSVAAARVVWVGPGG